MKFGAATIHRTFGIPVGYCGPARNKHSDGYLKRLSRLKAASLFVLDEFSMVGRVMLGKVVYKTRECLGGVGTMGDQDMILSGDVRQAPPVAEEPIYKVGRYTGRGKNLPPKGSPEGEAPSTEAFSNRGELLREEFVDAVILRSVHRIDRGENSGLSGEALSKYAADAD